MKRFNKKSKYIKRRKALRRKRAVKTAAKSNSKFARSVRKVIKDSAEHKFFYDTRNFSAEPPQWVCNGYGLQYALGGGLTYFPDYVGNAPLDPLTDASGQGYWWSHRPMAIAQQAPGRIGQEVFMMKSFTMVYPIISSVPNNIGMQTNYGYNLLIIEFMATKGQLGPNGSTLLSNIGSNVFTNWGATSAAGQPVPDPVINNQTIFNLCDAPNNLFDSKNQGFFIYKVHKWKLPPLKGELNQGESYLPWNTRPKKILSIRNQTLKYPTGNYVADTNTLPLNTNNRVALIVNDSPYNIQIIGRNYMSYIDM